MNTLGIIQVSRVVDYSDLLAFLMLPFSKNVMENIEQFELKVNHYLVRKIAFTSVLAITILTFIATSKEEPFTGDLSNCCALEPVNEKVGNGRIYIPTVFTPNGNQLNDVFQPSIDSNILSVDTFLVIEPFTKDTVFREYNLLELTPQNAYNGFANLMITSQYDYIISVTSKNQISKTFKGSVCAIFCGEFFDIPTPDSIANCSFPLQFNPDSGYDNTIDPEEDIDCFN